MAHAVLMSVWYMVVLYTYALPRQFAPPQKATADNVHVCTSLQLRLICASQTQVPNL